MINRNGIIAASTKHGMETPVAESDLFIHPPFFTLSSRPYNLPVSDSLSASISFGEAKLRSLVKKFDHLSDAVQASISFPLARLRSTLHEYEFKDAVSASIEFPQATLRSAIRTYGSK